MQPFRFIAVVSLVLASTTCQPPMQRSPVQSAAREVPVVVPATAPAPAQQEQPVQLASRVTPRPSQAPARIGTNIVLGMKTFPHLEEGELMFSVRVPREGWWAFCLLGTKPAEVRMSFHAVLPLGNDSYWQVDHFVIVREGETTVDACAQMEKTEKKLPAGQEVQIRSRFGIPGPIKVTGAFRQVDYPEATR